MCIGVNPSPTFFRRREILARLQAHVEGDGVLNELVLQHIVARRRILVLTSLGLWVVVKAS